MSHANGSEQSVTGTSTNAWSFEGKMLGQTNANGQGQAVGGQSSVFDVEGKRIALSWNLGTPNAKTRRYLNDGSNVVEERDGANAFDVIKAAT